ncbi:MULTISPECIES: hypothetical protein [Brevundimonas]|uniref:hypothetical protein n=1 Tax=Brevundimonas pishanensis TaxID=2896315 RepID=UPI001FA746C8|nr:hypothetical protein [Brevundimonas pishanensis]
MKMLIDFLAGIVAFLAAAALAQFGLNIDRVSQPLEIKRLPECHSSPDEAGKANASKTC